MSNKFSNISPKAKIGKGVKIESFVNICEDVEIGDGSWIGPNVTIMDGARIGKNCKIFPGAVISAIPQDLKFEGEKSFAIIGNNTTVREFATINRATNYSGITSVGDNCLIMAYVHIAHDCQIASNVILANSAQLGGHVEIDEHAIIGGISAIHQFVKIGSHTMVSGGSLVRKDIPPYIKVAKEPLCYIGVNSVGLSRKGFNAEKILEIQNIYRNIFQSNMNYTQALESIKKNFNSNKEINNIIQFISKSERGINKEYK